MKKHDPQAATIAMVSHATRARQAMERAQAKKREEK